MASTSEAAPERGQDTYHKSQWFSPDLAIPDSTRQVLEQYSKIPPDQVLPHVHAIREKAWAIHPYPCIGMGRFLSLAIGQHSLYHPEILPRMLTGQTTYLDLGCAFAQDIRRLVADGVDSSQCYGADLRLDFIELGYELFRDRETLKSRFIAADIFDPGSPLGELEGGVDIIDASSFFHLFTWDEQKEVARSVLKLLKPRRDSLVVGRQVGNLKPAEYPRRDGGGTRFRHDVESWQRMWEEVGEEVGVKFQVDGSMTVQERMKVGGGLEDEGVRVMEFSVRRLA